MAASDDARPPGELLVYQGQGLYEPIQVRLEGETVWLSQKLLAELYGVAVSTINEHISNIYDEDELIPEATIRKFRIVQTACSSQLNRRTHHPRRQLISAAHFGGAEPQKLQKSKSSGALTSTLFTQTGLFVNNDGRYLRQGEQGATEWTAA